MRCLLIKIAAKQKMKRFYLICVQPTLLGEYCVVRIHGRSQRAPRRSERVLPPLPYERAEEAQRAAERLVERRKKRGYVEDGQQPVEGGTNYDDPGATGPTPYADPPGSGA